MTNREFFEAIKNGTINADVQAYATAEIDKMNAGVERHEANTEPEQVGSVGGVMIKKMHACRKLGVEIEKEREREYEHEDKRRIK